jgi:short-subunit dehydrogenase
MAQQQPEVVVVTGASAGVGRATVREFAKHGAHIGLIARGRDRLDATRKEVEDAGGRALVLPMDVADAQAMEDAAGRVEHELGPIDIWINNAMATVFSPVRQMQADEYRRVTDVAYLGYVHGTLAALRYMLPRDQGTIVQVGSALAYRAIPLQSAYCAAKHAIAGFTESLRVELLHDGSNVHVTEVHLPGVNTPQFSWNRTRMPRRPQPVPPIFQPEVPARAIYWAAHHRRRELWVGWPTVQAILGDKIAPGLVDRYLVKSWDGQQYDGAVDPDRPDNLFHPVPGSYEAHGAFDDRARARSWQLWLNLHRRTLALAGAGAGAVVALGGMLLGRKR